MLRLRGVVIMTVAGNKMIADTDTCPEQINTQIENKREFSWEGENSENPIKCLTRK